MGSVLILQYPESPDLGFYMLLPLQWHAILKIRGGKNWYVFHPVLNIHWLIAFIVIILKGFDLSSKQTMQNDGDKKKKNISPY